MTDKLPKKEETIILSAVNLMIILCHDHQWRCKDMDDPRWTFWVSIEAVQAIKNKTDLGKWMINNLATARNRWYKTRMEIDQ